MTNEIKEIMKSVNSFHAMAMNPMFVRQANEMKEIERLIYDIKKHHIQAGNLKELSAERIISKAKEISESGGLTFKQVLQRMYSRDIKIT